MSSKVLVVEDDVALLEAISELVEALGHRVVRAENGREGLAQAKSEKPDLVLSGYMMPFMDGVDLVLALSKENGLSRTPIVVMSASPRPAALPASVPFLSKPFELEELRAVLANVQKPKRKTK